MILRKIMCAREGLQIPRDYTRQLRVIEHPVLQ